MLVFATPTQICLEIPSRWLDDAWEKSQSCASSQSRWRSYLNRLGLEAVLSGLQQEYALDAKIASNTAHLDSIWEFVEGSAIEFDNCRAILIPSEAIDEGELSVPQEWVDLPSWAGDYYLAVSVSPDDESVKIWGWTTHARLKENGYYDSCDRSYTLHREDLIPDLSVLLLARELCPEEVTRTAIAPLPNLSALQAENLCQRLGNAQILTPRLEIPFHLWGALLEREDYRKQLYRRRLGIAAPKVTRLSQWFANLADESWQSLESLLSPTESLAWRLRNNRDAGSARTECAKRLELQLPEQKLCVVLSIELKTEDDERFGVRVRLHPDRDRACLPANLKLALLSESGETLRTVESRPSDSYIQLPRFKCASGYRFNLQVTLDEISNTEAFEL
nr:DUF1822 family protein [Oscillatoria sp. FACHB-1406]